MSTIEGSVRQFGGGGGDMNDVSMGEMLFGGGGGGGSTGGRAQLDEGKDTEWEVRFSLSTGLARLGLTARI